MVQPSVFETLKVFNIESVKRKFLLSYPRHPRHYTSTTANASREPSYRRLGEALLPVLTLMPWLTRLLTPACTSRSMLYTLNRYRLDAALLQLLFVHSSAHYSHGIGTPIKYCSATTQPHQCIPSLPRLLRPTRTLHAPAHPNTPDEIRDLITSITSVSNRCLLNTTPSTGTAAFPAI